MYIIIKSLPWLIIVYGFWSGYELYEVRSEENESLIQEVSGLKSRLVKLEKAKKEIEAYYADIETAKSNIKKISKQFSLVQKKLPEKQNDKENFNLFKDIAKRVLIKEVKFTSGKDNPKKGYIEKSYTVNAKGTYMQFLLFFELLYKYEQLFDVKNILFRTANTEERGRFQVVEGQFDVGTYVYSGKLEENKSGDE